MVITSPRCRWRSHLGLLLACIALAIGSCGDDDGSHGSADVGSDLEPDTVSPDTSDMEPDDMGEEEEPDIPPLHFNPYVRGTFNGWEATDALPYAGGNIYAGSALISQGRHEFKIADESWSLDTIYSADATTQLEIQLDTEVPLVIATGYGNNTVIQIPEESEYTFTITVTPQTPDPALVLVVTQGATGPVDDLPDDSQVETFSAVTYAPVTLEGGEGMATPQDLFDQLAIVVPQGERVQYVLGDNIDGYVEGWTQSYSSASRYWLRSGYLLSYFASLVDGSLNDLEQDTTETHILPYGVRNHYGAGVWDELVLHAGLHAVSIRVHSDTPATLAIIPKLNLKRRTSTFERFGDTMVYALSESLRREGVPPFLAVAGDRAYQLVGADLEAMPVLTERVNILETDVKPLLTTTGEETDFRVVLAFGFTREEAAAQALALARRDAVGEQQQQTYDLLTSSYLWTDDLPFNRALMWAKLSAYGMVNEQFGTGIWAGLPWFKDNWGRDTFISLPGTLLVNGRFEEARAVIREFADLQNLDTEDVNYGRIPNRVTGPENIIYNTTDGTPWMVREILETVRYTGDIDFAEEMFPVVDRYISGAIEHFADEEGFLTHDDADTWMDARFGPQGEYAWSARGNRAVEIQALWYIVLRIAAELAADAGQTVKATAWNGLADTLQEHFLDRFWDDELNRMADRVRADDSQDFKVRPNQLMLVSIPFEERFVGTEVEAFVVRNAVGELLFPYGIASLSQDHPYFHPHHDNQPRFNKDAAYHNGTVWVWNAGFTITALTRFGYTDLAYELSTNMADQLLHMGTRGSLSELIDAHPDADGNIILSGTYSQTWSVAEYARNGYQDYLGFRPDLPAGRIALWPAIPGSWGAFHAQCPFGDTGRLLIDFTREGHVLTFAFEIRGYEDSLDLDVIPLAGHTRHRVTFPLAPETRRVLVFNTQTATATLDDASVMVQEQLGSQQETIGVLEFVAPDVDGEYPAMEQDNYLQGIIERGEYE